MVSITTTYLWCCSTEELLKKKVWTKGCDYVPIKFHLQKQAADQIYPAGHVLLTHPLEEL